MTRTSKYHSFFVALLVLFLLFHLYKFFFVPVYDDIYTPKPVFGNPNATVVVEEFSDLQCPACKLAHQHVEQLKQKYHNRAKFTYYHYPLIRIHPHAMQSAQAVECANDQGRFFEYIDVLFRNQDHLLSSDLKKYAVVLGLNGDLFSRCLDSKAKEGQVRLDIAEGNKRNLTFTPSIFVNGKLVEDWHKLEQEILQELENNNQ